MNSQEHDPCHQQPSSVDRILNTATEEFSQRGYQGARMDTIADRSNVNKATVYYHFDGKSGLYEAVVLRPLEEIVDGVDEPAGVESPEQRLRHWMRFIVREIRTHPEVAKLLLREITDGGNRLSDETTAVIQTAWTYFRELLEACREANNCSRYPLENVRRSIVGSVLLNSLETPFFEAITDRDADAYSVTDHELVDLLLSGLIDS